MAKTGENASLKNYTRKTKSLFIIFDYFESTLILENNRKKNPGKPYTNKYQDHVGCSFDYQLACVDSQFSKQFKPYFSEDNFHARYCSYCP